MSDNWGDGPCWYADDRKCVAKTPAACLCVKEVQSGARVRPAEEKKKPIREPPHE